MKNPIRSILKKSNCTYSQKTKVSEFVRCVFVQFFLLHVNTLRKVLFRFTIFIWKKNVREMKSSQVENVIPCPRFVEGKRSICICLQQRMVDTSIMVFKFFFPLSCRLSKTSVTSQTTRRVYLFYLANKQNVFFPIFHSSKIPRLRVLA